MRKLTIHTNLFSWLRQKKYNYTFIIWENLKKNYGETKRRKSEYLRFAMINQILMNEYALPLIDYENQDT